MPPRFKENWIVKVGKEVFSLDESQIIILKEAMKRKESRGLHYTLDYPECDDKNFSGPTVLS